MEKNERQKPGEDHNNEEIQEGMRLNKYVAHCGVCSRRQAAELIKNGQVTVNGVVVLEPWILVSEMDQVAYKGKIIKPEEKKVYILMNKPKNVITTASDEKARTTVLDIVGKKVKERIYPVGRLDRDTTGLLVLTNDGDLAQKLSHPSHGVKKIYHVVLDKIVTKGHMEAIANGLTLADGVALVDHVAYAEGKPKKEVIIEIHIGRNRIVRRIFESQGYRVIRLDRIYYAGLTKKDLPRSFYRHLTEKEIIMLKHFS